MKICPICDKEIKEEDKRYFFSNDKPYFNIYIHRTCRDAFTLEYLQQNIHKILEMCRNKKK